MVYLLFGAGDANARGAHTFLGAYTSREAAHEAALNLWFVGRAHLASWAHLAEFDGKTMRVTHWLNIPGTESDKQNDLVWVAYD